MTHVFHRNPHHLYPTAVKGQGPYLIDDQGKQYFDAGGAAVSCLGHSHPAVIKAVQQQVAELAFSHSGFFTNEKMEQLADHLISRAPGNLDKVYFVSGGSEAVESALKMARQYFTEKGEESRKYFIARKQSYHGNTLGALAVGGNAWRKKQFKPLLLQFEHISPCYPYRNQRDDEDEMAYSLRAANELEGMIKQLGAENVIGFVCEPVVGATLGAVAATKGYLKRIRQICNQYGILLIADEVMCGMGRTGDLFCHEHDDIDCDMVTIAKGLGGGYQPIGATLVSAEIYNTIYSGSGFFQGGHTYMGHATACAAGLAVQETIEQDDLLTNVRVMGEKLKNELNSAFIDHPNIGDIRGRGLFLGLEIVSDRATKVPFNPSEKINLKIKKSAMDLGLMCYPMGGTIDGLNGDHVLLAPPFIIDESHIDEIVSKLKQSFIAVLG